MADLAEIADPPAPKILLTAAQLQSGPPIDPLLRVLIYTATEWEAFVSEWVFSLKKAYFKVLRLTGTGDKGIDIAACTDDLLLNGVWDCYQCKHYNAPRDQGAALVRWDYHRTTAALMRAGDPL